MNAPFECRRIYPNAIYLNATYTNCRNKIELLPIQKEGKNHAIAVSMQHTIRNCCVSVSDADGTKNYVVALQAFAIFVIVVVVVVVVVALMKCPS